MRIVYDIGEIRKTWVMCDEAGQYGWWMDTRFCRDWLSSFPPAALMHRRYLLVSVRRLHRCLIKVRSRRPLCQQTEVAI